MRTSFTSALISGMLLLVVLGGCSTTYTPKPTVLSEQHRAQLGDVQVQARYRTAENIGGITTGKGSGAASGMGRAVGGLMDGAAGSGEPGAGLMVVLALPFAAVGGAVYGSVVADSAEDVTQQLQVMRTVLDAAPDIYAQQVQTKFVALPFVSVAEEDAGADIERANAKSRLAIHFHELRSVGGGPKSEIRFVLSTRTQLYAGADPYPMFARDYTVGSNTMRLSKWMADDGAPLQAALDSLAAQTLTNILNDHFISSPYRVEPLHPAKNYAFRPKRLESTTPMFRWELKEGALSVSQAAHAQLEYDLKLVQRAGDTIEMNGIKQNRFQVTQALPTCARYSWQVRANYTSVGQARSTDWSPVKEFRTPCPKK